MKLTHSLFSAASVQYAWKFIFSTPHAHEPGQISRYSDGLRARTRGDFLLYKVQTGSGSHPVSFPVDTIGSAPEGKVFGA
jgi:hypothetical protein